MTTKDVARYLGIHCHTVRKMAKSGRIPMLPGGRNFKFCRDEIEKWEKNRIPQTITIKEVAKYCGVSIDTVRKWAAYGRIPPKAIVKPPGTNRWLFRKDEIIKWAQYDPPRQRHVGP